MHLYNFLCAHRYIALTASVKFRIGSPKTAWNEHVCAHQKSYSSLSKFSKIFFEQLYTGCTVAVHLCCGFYTRREAQSVLATATWLAGWVAVCHSRCCIKTTKPILKLVRPSGRPVIEAFATPYADTKFQGEPLLRGRLMHGVGKIGEFQRILPFISETVRDRTMVTIERQ